MPSRRKSPASQGFLRRSVEAAGIEPTSADAPVRASTSLGCALLSPAGRCQPTYRRASHPLVSRLGRLALPWRRARSLTPLPEPRAESGATRHLDSLGGECEFVLRTCVVPGCFTRPTGDLGLQLSRRTDHVETRSPPYVRISVARGMIGSVAEIREIEQDELHRWVVDDAGGRRLDGHGRGLRRLGSARPARAPGSSRPRDGRDVGAAFGIGGWHEPPGVARGELRVIPDARGAGSATSSCTASAPGRPDWATAS